MTLPSLAGAVDGWYDNTAPDPRWWRTTSGRDRRQPDVAHRTVGVTADCAWVPAYVEKIVPSARGQSAGRLHPVRQLPRPAARRDTASCFDQGRGPRPGVGAA